MKCLILFVLAAVAQAQYNQQQYLGPLAVPSFLPNGQQADTPEVTAAKNAHAIEYSRALAAAGASPSFSAQAPFAQASQQAPAYRGFQSPQASNTFLPNGQQADTPEVAPSRYAHANEYSRALAAAGASSSFSAPAPFAQAPQQAPAYRGFQGPLASITVLPNGQLADTPEVAAAKNAHAIEHARARAAAGPSSGFSNPSAFAPPPEQYSRFQPQAQVQVLPDGKLADTPDVAAAKNAFFAQYQRALAHSR